MTDPPRRPSFKAIVLLQAAVLFLAVDAYQPSLVPRVRNSDARRPKTFVGHHTTASTTSLCAVAEFEELQRHDQHNSNNKNDKNSNNVEEDAEWIETPSGGFLPNLFRRLQPSSGGGSCDLVTIEEVSTLQDYKRVVADEHEQMVVVLFAAPWCRACKATQPLFRKLARDYSNNANASANNDSSSSSLLPVKFVRVPLTPDNGFLHDGLGVPSLPFGHLYHPTAGLVEERKLNKHVFAEFRSVLQDYVRGYCDIVPSENGSEEDNVARSSSEERMDEEPSMS